MNRRLLTLMITVLMVIGMYAAAIASPKPPTNGGNGAGSSGQCTGAAWARPTSCQSPGGVSGK